MKASHNRSTVFIGAPFSNVKDEEGLVINNLQFQILSVKQSVEENGFTVFSSHIRENWGKDVWEPINLAQGDLIALDEASHYIAIISDGKSYGVPIEIGYAIAKGIPVLLIVNIEIPKSDFLNGLIALNLVQVCVGFQMASNCQSLISDFLSSVKGVRLKHEGITASMV